MEIVKKTSTVVVFLIVLPLIFALLSDVIDKPAGKSLIERFVYMFVLFLILLGTTKLKPSK